MRGFSLMELLVVLTIVGIVLAGSVPLYSQYVTKARRLQAESTLSRLSVAMERYRIEHNTYQGATVAALHVPATIAKGRYNIGIQQASLASYVLTATPHGSQAVRDAACGTLGMSATGEKTISGNGRVQACW